MNIKDLTVDGTVYKAVQNKAGYVTIDGLTTDHIGGVGVGNVAVTAGGSYGWIHASNMHIAGCTDYNFVSYGGEVSIKDSTFELTPATNIYIRNGKGTLENVKVLGSTTEGKASVACGSTAYRTSDVTIGGDETYITGGSRGVSNYGTLVLNGGTITGNRTTGEHEVGGGVYNVGTFTMNGGTISGNTCTTYGGGVRNGTSDGHYGVMYMYGGTISGNRAGTNGGGVSVGSKKTAFYMYGGTVSGNTAASKGDGVMVAGTFEYYDGSISDNDVFLYDVSDYVTVRSGSFGGKGIVVNSTSFADTGKPAVRFLSESDAQKLGDRFVCGSDQWTFERQGADLVTRIALNDISSDVSFSGAQTVSVSSFAQLKQAVESTSGKKIIQITANIPMTGLITVPEGAAVQLTDDGSARTLNRSAYKGVLFEVGNRATLALTGSAGLAVDGNSGSGYVASDPLIKATYGGVVLLQKGAALQHAANDTYASSDRAGAVNVYGGRMIVEGGTIRNCAGYGKNGGATENLTAVYVSPSSVVSVKSGSLENCPNGAVRSYGRVYVSGGTISGNSRIGDGGAAIRAAVLQMTGGTISGNKSSNSGGAVYITGSESYPNALFRMTGGAITGNTSARQVDTNASGGAVYIGKFATFDFQGGEISKNVSGDASNGMGGGGIYAEIATVNVGKNAKVIDNLAYNSGGGIFAAGTRLNVADGAVISGNRTVGVADGYGSGGAIMLTSCTETATGKRFHTTADIGAATISDNLSGNSGVIYVDAGAKLTMTGTTVSGNKATGECSSTWASGSAVMNKNVLEMTDCVISGNTAQGLNPASNYKGAVYNNGASAKLTVTGGSFDKNVATGSAALCNDGGTALVKGASFTGNVALQPTDSSTTGGNGGAVMNQGNGVMTLEDCTFTGNTATTRAGDGKGGEGGAVYNDVGTLTVIGGAFSGNTARVGADILNSSNATLLTLDGALQVQEIYLATGHPAAVGKELAVSGDAALTLPDGAYRQGTAVLTGTVSDTLASSFRIGDGTTGLYIETAADHAGLLTDGSPWILTAKIGEAEFYSLESAVSNAAEGDTIVLVASDVTLSSTLSVKKNVTITTDGSGVKTIHTNVPGAFAIRLEGSGNTAEGKKTISLLGTESSPIVIDGGGTTASRSLMLHQYADVTMRYVTIQNGACSGANYPGGLYVTGGSAAQGKSVLEHCEIAGCSGGTTGYGAALYLTASGSVEMTDCTVRDNTNVSGGSIIQIAQSGGTTAGLLQATRTAFTGNAVEGSSGLVKFTGAAVLSQCDFSGNTVAYEVFESNNTSAAAFVRSVTDSTFDVTESEAIGGQADTLTSGRLTNSGNRFVAAKIGETVYFSLADALAAAKSGDVIDLYGDAALPASFTVAADTELTLRGAVTVTGDAAVKGTLHLADVTLSGSVDASGATLGLGGAASVTGKVNVSGGGKIHVDSALTADKAATVAGAAVGDTVLTADGSETLSAAAGKFALDTDDAMTVINSAGTVEKLTALVKNNNKDAQYVTLAEALAAADAGDVLELLGNAPGTTVERDVVLTGGYQVTGTTVVAKDVTLMLQGGVTLEKADLTAEGSGLSFSGTLTADKIATVLVGDAAAAKALAEAGTVKLTGDVAENLSKLALDEALGGAYRFSVEGKLVPASAATINGTPYDTLEEAIEAAAAGDTVVITDDVELSGQIKLDKKITLTTDGTTHTITGKAVTGSSYFLNVTAEGVAIKGTGETGRLILDGGSKDGDTHGRALVCLQAANCEVSYVTLQNNSVAGYSGGGLYTNKKGQTLDHVDFINCKADTTGAGGLYLTAAGGAELTDCKFTDCQSLSGGAIFAASNASGGAAVTAKGCEFTGNKATSTTGGAITVSAAKSNGGGATVTLEDCTFTKNAAQTTGGAIHAVGGADYGHATLSAKSCRFVENTAATNGGAINGATGASITLDQCTVTGNKAAGNGSAVYLAGGAAAGSTLTVTGTTFKGNTAGSTAALYMGTAGNTNVTVTGCTFDTSAADSIRSNLSFPDNTYNAQ
ncbi:MAG: hypothetical protein IJU18_04395 [Oscillospiraceae bacterium]|nr:hypothetical protein [Oscillospiraceae bacterium]